MSLPAPAETSDLALLDSLPSRLATTSSSACADRRLTAVAICASLGVNLQARRKRVLQEVHVEVVLALHRFLYTQLEDVGEVAGGVKSQIHHRIPDAEKKGKQKGQKTKGEKTGYERVILIFTVLMLIFLHPMLTGFKIF